MVNVDKKRMTEAVGHLLSNSIKCSTQGGVVHVSVELVEKDVDGKVEKYAKILVRDYGQGFTPVTYSKLLSFYYVFSILPY